ncbi:alpha/beta fold hydrolase [Roseibium album]|uniref:alpha/beta fold hydrolase n=1 Tax=Roseibium album TaxID=311410 RepID=UPI003D663230
MNAKTPPAILFLHALPLDGTMWLGQLDLFPTACYAPTLYRHGNWIENWATAALKEVHEEEIIVIGCSIGGSCALEIAKLAPHRVRAIVLAGTKAHKNPNPVFLEQAVNLIRTRGPNAAWNAFWKPLFSVSSNDDVVRAAKESFDKRSARELVDGTVAFHMRPSRRDLLESFPHRTVFISGSHDIAPGPELTFKQAQTARDGSCHVIPNCGHYAPLEATSAFNAILRQELLVHFPAECGS